jgi:hypothetical protein
MLTNTLVAVGLVVTTVCIHAVGFDSLLRIVIRSHTLDRSGFWSVTPTVIGLTLWLMLIHIAEIAVWGQFYFRWGCMPDAETAFYFSAVTYTTVGYGDLTLPLQWRNFGPLEALTGIIMCGLSTGLFFGLVLRWIGNWTQQRRASEAQPAVAQR